MNTRGCNTRRASLVTVGISKRDAMLVNEIGLRWFVCCASCLFLSFEETARKRNLYTTSNVPVGELFWEIRSTTSKHYWDFFCFTQLIFFFRHRRRPSSTGGSMVCPALDLPSTNHPPPPPATPHSLLANSEPIKNECRGDAPSFVSSFLSHFLRFSIETTKHLKWRSSLFISTKRVPSRMLRTQSLSMCLSGSLMEKWVIQNRN